MQVQVTLILMLVAEAAWTAYGYDHATKATLEGFLWGILATLTPLCVMPVSGFFLFVACFATNEKGELKRNTLAFRIIRWFDPLAERRDSINYCPSHWHMALWVFLILGCITACLGVSYLTLLKISNPTFMTALLFSALYAMTIACALKKVFSMKPHNEMITAATAVYLFIPPVFGLTSLVDKSLTGNFYYIFLVSMGVVTCLYIGLALVAVVVWLAICMVDEAIDFIKATPIPTYASDMWNGICPSLKIAPKESGGSAPPRQEVRGQGDM